MKGKNKSGLENQTDAKVHRLEKIHQLSGYKNKIFLWIISGCPQSSTLLGWNKKIEFRRKKQHKGNAVSSGKFSLVIIDYHNNDYM